MVAAAALGDVVQQHRNIEHPARGDLAEQGGRQRMVVGQLAALDPRQQADRPDRMLVDRIMVVHVELHLRDDPAEVGHEAAEHAGLVHPAQRDIGLVARGQHFEEEGIGARVVADLVDQPRIARRRAHRVGMDFQPLARRQREQFDQPHWISANQSVVGDRQAARDRA